MAIRPPKGTSRRMNTPLLTFEKEHPSPPSPIKDEKALIDMASRGYKRDANLRLNFRKLLFMLHLSLNEDFKTNIL